MTTKIDGLNGVLQSYDYQVPTTGFSYTFAAGITNLIMNPAGTLATGTITMPASPADGMTITFSSTQTITALTVNGNTGQIIVGAPTTLTAGAVVVLVYRLSASTWITQVNTNSSGATGVPVLNVFTANGTWTKSATVKAIKVTVVGGGGSGGNSIGGAGAGGFTMYTGTGGGGGGGASVKVYPAPSLPGPQPYTVGPAGSTSSFGVAPVTVISATGGSSSSPLTAPGSASVISSGAGAAGGAGSSGDLNVVGNGGGTGVASTSGTLAGNGGGSMLGGGAIGTSGAGTAGSNYGGGGSGSSRAATSPSPGTNNGGAGAAGVVIVEEFY
jgi:hypothetical protein